MKMANKSVDIIIPIYNAADDLKICLDSIYKNTDLIYESLLHPISYVFSPPLDENMEFSFPALVPDYLSWFSQNNSLHVDLVVLILAFTKTSVKIDKNLLLSSQYFYFYQAF